MMDLFLDAFAHLEKNPAFWLCLTLSFYVLGQVIFKAAKFNPFLSPIIISVVCLISFLVATGVPYETYFSGANFIHFLLGPATVALAVPIYEQRSKLARLWLPLLTGLLAGCTAAMVSDADVSRPEICHDADCYGHFRIARRPSGPHRCSRCAHGYDRLHHRSSALQTAAHQI